MNNKKPHLLLVEDDKNLGLILKDYLEAKGFQTDLGKDGEEGLQLFYANNYDICILDVMMPKKDGFALAEEIKAKSSHIPILFLTAKSLKEDTIKGFKIGADDYVTKPFHMEELLLRIQAILKRTSKNNNNKPNSNFIQMGNISFYPKEYYFEVDGKKEKLSPKENDLLHLLIKHKDEVVDRSIALKVVWNDDSYYNSRSMDVYLNKLRKKLAVDPNIQLMTVHGHGLKLIY
jgi:two-component system, OmpR family, response regulator VicR